MADAPYTQITRTQVNQWNEQLQTAQAGVLFTVRWLATDTVFKVFVPGEPPLPADVDRAILARGAVEDQYAKLGK